LRDLTVKYFSRPHNRILLATTGYGLALRPNILLLPSIANIPDVNILIQVSMFCTGRRCSEFFQRQRVRVSCRWLSQLGQHENKTASLRHSAVRLGAEHVSLRQPLHQALQHARYTRSIIGHL